MLTATAITVAARYQIAAPAPALEVGGGTLGATIAGLAITIWVAARWKHTSKEARQHFVLGAVAVAMLATAGGLLGQIIGTAQQTGGQIGTTFTQTSVGR